MLLSVNDYLNILPPSPSAITLALNILLSGGTVAHATETCYGLACDMTNQEAVKKLFEIKKRKPDQPVSALFPSIEASQEWVEWCREALKLARKELPGPLTIVLPIKENKIGSIFPMISTALLRYCAKSGQSPTLGIRISSHPVAIELAERFGKPISTTSANISGRPNPYSVEDIKRQFAAFAAESRSFSLREQQPDLIIDSGTLEKRPPSRVVTFENGEIITLRQP